MKYKQFEIWLAELNPRFGTEPGKTRPVLIVQTDLLNKLHPSSLVCPITSNVKSGATILRLKIAKGTSGMKQNSDIMIDQLRAIDNKRFIKRLGDLPPSSRDLVKENLKIVLDLI